MGLAIVTIHNQKGIDMDYHVQFKRRSDNAKTGPIPTSVTESSTCPDRCPLSGAGCYAETGPVSWNWKKVDSGQRGGSFSEFLESVKSLPDDQLWRHNVAGDLPGIGDGTTINANALRSLVRANKGRRGFTYTHYDPTIKANRRAIKDANREGFTVNLSANSVSEVDELADLNIAPVVTLLPATYQRDKGETLEGYRERLETLPKKTDAGRRLVVCPATYQDTITCATCRLCQRKRPSIIGFPVHGSRKRLANETAIG